MILTFIELSSLGLGDQVWKVVVVVATLHTWLGIVYAMVVLVDVLFSPLASQQLVCRWLLIHRHLSNQLLLLLFYLFNSIKVNSN